jgi:hypothetical protein
MLANFKNNTRCFWSFTQQSWRFLYWWFYFGRSHSPGTGCFGISQRLDISPLEYQPTHHTLWCQNCQHLVGWEADCKNGWLKVADFGLSKLGPWTWLWIAWRLLQYRIMLWLQMQINENNNQSMFMTTAREVFCVEVMRPSSFQCSGWWQCYIQSCKT